MWQHHVRDSFCCHVNQTPHDDFVNGKIQAVRPEMLHEKLVTHLCLHAEGA